MRRPTRVPRPAARPLPGAGASLFVLAAALLAGAVHPAGEAAAQSPGEELALVYQLRLADGGRGLVAERAGVEEVVPLDLGDLLNDGDNAYTLEGTRAAIQFADDASLVRMNENTELRIRAEGEDRGSLRRIIELEGGELWARITGGTGRETQIRTPSGVAAVRGTDFIVRYDRETGELTVITLEGLLEFFNDAGSVEIPAGRKVGVGASDEPPEVVPMEEGDLDSTRALLDDQAETESGGFVELVILGEGGREVRIQIGRSALDPGPRGGPR